MNVTPQHRPLDRQRHADMVVYLCRHRPDAWMALFRPSAYEYDEQDRELAIELENKCAELRVAIQKATRWEEAVRMLRMLVRCDNRRRQISVGIKLGDRTINGESLV